MKLLISALVTGAAAFSPRFAGRSSSTIRLDMSKVGIFFGTSTGSTQTVADLLAQEIGEIDADGPFDIETIEGAINETFEKYNALIVGTPTWNTGADTERSGTGWDELYYGTMKDLNIKGKKVAVFGLGDQVSYSENYADATGELHDVFQNLGCQMMGYTSQEGYEHESSKAIRGNRFCGLLCDMVNQEELTEERVKNWVAQLKLEGFFDGVVVGSAAPVAKVPSTVVESMAVETLSVWEEHSHLLDNAIETHANAGFQPYPNPKTKTTMWVSSDGRSCYYTADSANTPISP